MQMRLARIARIADSSQYLAAPHAVPSLYTQASWLQMQIVCELPATQVERDGVTRNRFQRDRHGRVEQFVVPRHVIWKTISSGNHVAVGNRQHCLPIRVIRAHVPRVAGERSAVFDLLPIDRISSGNHRSAINYDNS